MTCVGSHRHSKKKLYIYIYICVCVCVCVSVCMCYFRQVFNSNLLLSSRKIQTTSLVLKRLNLINNSSIQPLGRFSRNQSPVRRPVWLWQAASWASSQGQVAIAFPRLQTFPPSPPGAFTSNNARDPQQRKVEIFVGEKRSDKFRLEFDFHVILEIFTQICDMGQTALLPLRRKAC